ncbi:3-deoxy-manno-octulosonate-8-phosphatase KdsC [soil metagenome]
MLPDLSKIELILMDMDGCLTTGHIVYSSTGEDIKMFHTHDGFGLTRGCKLGMKFAVISGMGSPVNKRRVDRLGIHHLYEHIDDKLLPAEDMRIMYDLSYENIAYIGDDIFDIPLLKKVGFSVCPANAMDEVKENVNYICKRNGGEGAIREMIDMILRAKKLL